MLWQERFAPEKEVISTFANITDVKLKMLRVG